MRVTIKSFTSFSRKWPLTNLHCFAFNLYLFSLSLWFFVLLSEIINFWHHSQYGKRNYKSMALPHYISHMILFFSQIPSVSSWEAHSAYQWLHSHLQVCLFLSDATMCEDQHLPHTKAHISPLPFVAWQSASDPDLLAHCISVYEICCIPSVLWKGKWWMHMVQKSGSLTRTESDGTKHVLVIYNF